ncbi:MAG TPA: tetratricopeptide repeat protein, partial [Fimbriimonadaceae bacterium]|nr:tetratricopeptide repeat protein [Fimbriimonadaceae bacterium]
SWTVQAAQRLLPPTLDGRALELLEALYDKSLIQLAEGGDGVPRSFLLESIREFALRELLQTDAGDAVSRYLSWYIEFFVQMQREWIEGDPTAGAKLDDEIHNANQGVEWAARLKAPGRGLELAGLLWDHWRRRGMYSEGRRLHRALLSSPDLTREERAQGLSRLGVLAWYQNDLNEAQQCTEASLRLYEQEGNRLKITTSLNNLGLISIDRGSLELGRSYLQRALDGFTATQDDHNRLSVLVNLGMLELDSGNFAEAEERLKHALSLAESARDDATMAILFCNMAECFILQQRRREAAAWLRKAVLASKADAVDLLALENLFLVAAALFAQENRPEEALFAFASHEELRAEGELPITGRTKRLYDSVEPLLVRADAEKLRQGPLGNEEPSRNCRLEAVLSALDAYRDAIPC